MTRGGRGAGRGPLPYKEFMRELPDDITPEDAQKEFQAYLTRWWGSKVRRGGWVLLRPRFVQAGFLVFLPVFKAN